MCDQMDAAAVQRVLLRLTTLMEAEQDRLTELDSALGDGDLGVTMALGCKAIREQLSSLQDASIATVLTQAGTAFGGRAASTMGVLIATGLMRAGKEAQNLTSLSTADTARLARAAMEAIMQRGRAQVGDKTVLDAMHPAVEALDRAALEGSGLPEALSVAAAAAQTGAEATATMKSRIGRAGWLQDRSIGHLDPGAVAFATALHYLAQEFHQGG